MPVYTVHAPVMSNANGRVTDRFAFVRDGFHFWAALLSPVWLALAPAVAGADRLDRPSQSADGSELALPRRRCRHGDLCRRMLLIALLMGFEAASLWRWTLSRRNWRQLDIVVADDEEQAERRFFDRWTAKQRALGNDQSAVDRGAPPPTRDIPGQPFSKPPAPYNDIIGLFPEPGGSR